MSHWNYRLVKRKDGLFGVHEVYYNANGEPWGMTANAVDLGNFEDIEDVAESVRMIAKDITTRPLLVEPEVWASPDFKRDIPAELLESEDEK